MKKVVLVRKSFVWNLSTSYTLFGECMCVCLWECRCAPTFTYSHFQYLWLAFQVKTYTCHKSVGWVCVRVCLLLQESCISYMQVNFAAWCWTVRIFIKIYLNFYKKHGLSLSVLPKTFINHKACGLNRILYRFYWCMYFLLNSKPLYLHMSTLKLWSIRIANTTYHTHKWKAFDSISSQYHNGLWSLPKRWKLVLVSLAKVVFVVSIVFR